MFLLSIESLFSGVVGDTKKQRIPRIRCPSRKYFKMRICLMKKQTSKIMCDFSLNIIESHRVTKMTQTYFRTALYEANKFPPIIRVA